MSNEKVLFLLNRGTGVSPYSHQFMPEEIDPQILSGFISAITSFMDEASGPAKTHLQTVDSSDASFLLEGGVDDANLDPDSDFRTNLQEYQMGSDPHVSDLDLVTLAALFGTTTVLVVLGGVLVKKRRST